MELCPVPNQPAFLNSFEKCQNQGFCSLKNILQISTRCSIKILKISQNQNEKVFSKLNFSKDWEQMHGYT
jgi:hypothetical protein